MTSLTDNPQVQQLIDLFDLEAPNSYRMVVTKWEKLGNGVVVLEAEAYDTNNNFVKKVDFEQLQHNMHKYSFTFLKQER